MVIFSLFSPLTAVSDYIRFLFSYRHIKYQLFNKLKIKRDSKISKSLTSILSNLSYFQLLEAVYRISETQLNRMKILINPNPVRLVFLNF